MKPTDIEDVISKAERLVAQAADDTNAAAANHFRTQAQTILLTAILRELGKLRSDMRFQSSLES